MPTHYEVLGIAEGASEEEVRQAYRRLVKASHPDLAGDPARFRAVAQAYDVLSDPARREAYDRRLGRSGPEPLAAPPAPRRRRSGWFAVLALAALLVAGVVALAVATARQSVGDDCLIGTWRGDAFEVPFRGFLDGREVTAPITGGSGVTLRVAERGTVRTDYAGAAPLAGAEGPYRIEGVYRGTTSERWEAGGGRLKQIGTDTSVLRFSATINGRPPDQPLAVTVVDREYPYTCTPSTLEIGPYRYTRA